MQHIVLYAIVLATSPLSFNVDDNSKKIPIMLYDIYDFLADAGADAEP